MIAFWGVQLIEFSQCFYWDFLRHFLPKPSLLSFSYFPPNFSKCLKSKLKIYRWSVIFTSFCVFCLSMYIVQLIYSLIKTNFIDNLHEIHNKKIFQILSNLFWKLLFLLLCTICSISMKVFPFCYLNASQNVNLHLPETKEEISIISFSNVHEMTGQIRVSHWKDRSCRSRNVGNLDLTQVNVLHG